MPIITIKVARTDGKSFDSRRAFVEKTALAFNASDVATLNRPGRAETYRLNWIVTGAAGEYQVQITTPEEAIDKDANSRKRKIDLDGFGSGQRRFKVD